MKRITLLLLLFGSHWTFTQNSLNTFERTDFSSWEVNINDSLRLKYIELFRNSTLYKTNIDLYESKYLEGNICFLDFDKDGLIDIVYEGYLNGGESEYIVAFHHSNNGLEKILEIAGYPVEVSDPKISESLHFKIKNYGCCEDVISVIESYTFAYIDLQPAFILKSKYSFMDLEQCTFPENYFEKPIQFETINSRYTLRFSPEINDSTAYTSYIVGNGSAIYPQGSIGVALAEKIDESGRIWWFVYMKNNLKPIENNLHHGANNDQSYFSYGWLSSRYVAIIE